MNEFEFFKLKNLRRVVWHICHTTYVRVEHDGGVIEVEGIRREYDSRRTVSTSWTSSKNFLITNGHDYVVFDNSDNSPEIEDKNIFVTNWVSLQVPKFLLLDLFEHIEKFIPMKRIYEKLPPVVTVSYNSPKVGGFYNGKPVFLLRKSLEENIPFSLDLSTIDKIDKISQGSLIVIPLSDTRTFNMDREVGEISDTLKLPPIRIGSRLFNHTVRVFEDGYEKTVIENIIPDSIWVNGEAWAALVTPFIWSNNTVVLESEDHGKMTLPWARSYLLLHPFPKEGGVD